MDSSSKGCLLYRHKAKFQLNPLLLNFLPSTSPLRLAESSYNKLWGTGLPLNDTNALDPTHWINQRLLGEILMEMRYNTIYYLKLEDYLFLITNH